MHKRVLLTTHYKKTDDAYIKKIKIICYLIGNLFNNTFFCTASTEICCEQKLVNMHIQNMFSKLC